MSASPRQTDASRPLRLAAFVLDALLALLVAVGLRLLVRTGVLPSIGSWHFLDAGAHLDAQLAGLTLALLALRDVPGGSSAAKWLLCLRLVNSAGGRLTAFQRLLRSPVSLLPLALLPALHRLPWRVVAYTPGRPGLMARATLTGFAAAFSLLWAIESVRPSIGEGDASRLAEMLTQGDALRQKLLGAPLSYRIVGIQRRAHQPERGERATFELRIEGRLGHQTMNVYARKVDGDWHIEELHDIQTTLEPGAPEMANR